MKERVRVAVIGTGNFAQQQHIPNLARVPEVELRVLVNRTVSKAEACAEQYQVPEATSDVAGTLAREDIDAVVVTVRDDLQPEVSIQALQAGKHVYVEKPLGDSPEAILPVVEAEKKAAEQGIRLAVGFNKRYAPVYRKVMEIVAKKGTPKNMHLQMTDDAWRWAHGYPEGHLLKMDVCHFFDLIRMMTSSEIAQVSCLSARAEDDAILVGMKDGSVCTINFSGNASMDMPKERFHAILDRGGMTAEDYVSLFVYGYHDIENSYHFAGHTQPAGPYLHKPLMEKLGFEGWRAIRRSVWEAREQVVSGAVKEMPTGPQVSRFVGSVIPNFVRDQGWYASIRDFMVKVQNKQPLGDHAGAFDALQASRASLAAEESRRKGQIIQL